MHTVTFGELINAHCVSIVYVCRAGSKVALHLGYCRFQVRCDGKRWRTGGEFRKFAVHLK